MNALLITTDLIATAAVEGAARSAGVALQIAAPKEASTHISEATRFVAVDLTARFADLAELIRELRAAAPAATLLAYGPHVHEQRLAGAREAGFDLVVSRGQFHKQARELIERYAAEA